MTFKMTLDTRNCLLLECIISFSLIRFGSAVDIKQIFSNAVETVQSFACKHISCCEFHLNQKTSWLNGNKRLLEVLDQKLYGQHLAKEMIFEAVSQHMIKPTAKEMSLEIMLKSYTKIKDYHEEYMSMKENTKPLRILMYGPTGTGKNYASQLIAESIYKQGLKSPLVHVFAGKATLPVERDAVYYSSHLMQWLQGNTTACPYSMFIFDEFDHWPESLVEMTKSLSASGDFRNSIFIYIINSGGTEVVENLIELYESGMIREDIEISHVQKSPQESASSYFKKKDQSNDEVKMIDYIIPFLPLEEKHVQKCIVDHFIDKGRIYPSEEMIKAVLGEIKFGPEDKEVFSILGCKRIHSLVINALSSKYRWREEL